MWWILILVVGIVSSITTAALLAYAMAESTSVHDWKEAILNLKQYALAILSFLTGGFICQGIMLMHDPGLLHGRWVGQQPGTRMIPYYQPGSPFTPTESFLLAACSMALFGFLVWNLWRGYQRRMEQESLHEFLQELPCYVVEQLKKVDLWDTPHPILPSTTMTLAVESVATEPASGFADEFFAAVGLTNFLPLQRQKTGELRYTPPALEGKATIVLGRDVRSGKVVRVAFPGPQAFWQQVRFAGGSLWSHWPGLASVAKVIEERWPVFSEIHAGQEIRVKTIRMRGDLHIGLALETEGRWTHFNPERVVSLAREQVGYEMRTFYLPTQHPAAQPA